ncbi:MAG TPA: CbiX/SirB N-terminal domain-containing protein [Aggregatilineales bacterium]|nr:CbiX/SirB N-terminal domain-containing protein [Aggregatilineales bacterium]
MKHALIIAAHGSHYNPGTALPVWRCVDNIRQSGLFDEVTAAFWKEQPSFGTVLAGLVAESITIVPLFTSEGYFTRRVLRGELQPRSDQRISITQAVGATDFFTPIIARHIETALYAESIAPQHTAVVIVGHGTPRHGDSTATTEHQARLITATGRFGEVRTAYLDEAPYIADIYETSPFNTLVIVPYFIAEGLHTQTDIPEALNLHEPLYEAQIINGRRGLYTPPVGLEDDLYKVVLGLAGENPNAELNESMWHGFPINTFDLTGDSVGQISLRHETYLCHIDDENEIPESLENLQNPEQIRARMRFTESGVYRPLASAKTLPGGWKIPTPDEMIRAAALETIYPGSNAIDSRRSVKQVGMRQRGIYRPVAELSPEHIAALVEQVCSGCVRHPLWHDESDTGLRCVEACSVWLDAAIQSENPIEDRYE